MAINMNGMRMTAEDMNHMAEPDKVEVKDNGGTYVARFERYSGWPEIKEAFMAGKVAAAYLLAPLAMDLADKGIPARIVALGHRSGAVIMVRKDDPAKNLGDLRGNVVRDPWIPNFARADRIVQCSERLFERRSGIREMQVVDIDVIGRQSP